MLARGVHRSPHTTPNLADGGGEQEADCWLVAYIAPRTPLRTSLMEGASRKLLTRLVAYTTPPNVTRWTPTSTSTLLGSGSWKRRPVSIRSDRCHR